MSEALLRILSAHTPTNNDEKKLFEGETVASIDEIKIVKSGSGKEWLIVDMVAFHPIAPKGNKTSNINPGERMAKVYDPDDSEQVAKFSNDMFTAGIAIDSSNPEAFQASLDAAKGKLVYLKCWTYEKKDGSGKSGIVAVRSKKLITADLTVPIIPF